MKILYVDDEKRILDDTKEILESKEIDGHRIEVIVEPDFLKAIFMLDSDEFDLIIVDVYRGSANPENQDKAGIEVLDKVKSTRFVPVIFYTGLVNQVEHLASEVVRIVSKGDGTEKLEAEIGNLSKSGLLNIRRKILDYAEKTIRFFFWDFVSNHWDKLKGRIESDDLILLLVRRLAIQLSKENLSRLPLDLKYEGSTVRPLEFYVFPPIIDDRFEAGDILERDGKVYVVLTPTCDLIPRNNGNTKVKYVLMVEAIPLKNREEYKEYSDSKSNGKKKELLKLMENRKSSLFFLPGFPLMEDQILDFQSLSTEPIEDVKQNYQKIAKLDSPFAEAMLSNFLNHYDRIGIPNLDVERLLDSMFS